MGKGSKQRPPQISPEEEDLRWRLARQEITEAEFWVGMEALQKEGKIYRRPRYQLKGN